MRTSLLIIPALVISALLVACRENPVEPLQDAAQLDLAGPPEYSGPWVVRGEDPAMFSSFFTRTPDGNEWIGWTGMPADPNDLTFCGADESLAEVVSFKNVERPDRVVSLQKGQDRRLTLWHADVFLATWFAEGLCVAFELPILYEGTATHEVNNDNDLFGQTSNNVWGYRLHGRVDDWHVMYHFKARYHPGQGFRLMNEQGSIH